MVDGIGKGLSEEKTYSLAIDESIYRSRPESFPGMHTNYIALALGDCL